MERGGGEGEWVQFNANHGQEWTSIRITAQEGDFQVSRKGKLARKWERRKKGGNKKGITKGVVSLCLYYVYYANKRLCLGYK